MKLIDLLIDLEKKTDLKQPTFTLHSSELKSFEKDLFECDEFKNVVRLNFVDFPTYLADESTEEPISSNREFLGGKTKVIQTATFGFKSEQEIKFDKFVDLYCITLEKVYYKKEEINKPGVWIYPTFYDTETFIPTNQIKVIWDPAQLDEALKLMGSTETSKQRLLRMFETALDSMEPNIPCDYQMTIRCSNRSIIVNRNDVEPAKELESTEVKSINIDIPPVV